MLRKKLTKNLKKKSGRSEKMDIYFCPFLESRRKSFYKNVCFFVMQSYALILKIKNTKNAKTFFAGTFFVSI